MLPAPATMAASPATRSSVPWNPAVPPPPVTGAAVGTGVAVVVTVAVGMAVEVTVAVGVAVVVRVTVCVGCGVSVAGELELTPGVVREVPVPGEGVLPELPAEAETETETEPLTVTDGEKTLGGVVDDDQVHA